jgi:predicted ATPase
MPANWRITLIHLRRFKSLRDQGLELDNPTFLVGPNGSGKSNIVSALSFLADAMSLPLQAALDIHGGIENVRHRTPGGGRPATVGVLVLFYNPDKPGAKADYSFEVKVTKAGVPEVASESCTVEDAGAEVYFRRAKGKFETNVEGISPSIEPTALALPLLSGSPAFAPVYRVLSAIRTHSIDTTALREPQKPSSGRKLERNGSNAASVLRELRTKFKGDYERLCELLRAIVPGITSVREIKLGDRLTLRFTQDVGDAGTLVFDAFSMSDGTLRAIGLLLAIFQQPTPPLVVIEEPEATIHPGALGVLLDAIRHAARKTQVVVTTHSPEVLDAPWIEDRHIRIVEWRDGCTHVSGLAWSSREALREQLMTAGELLRANALEAEAPGDGSSE